MKRYPHQVFPFTFLFAVALIAAVPQAQAGAPPESGVSDMMLDDSRDKLRRSIERGRVEQGLYLNAFFGFELQTRGWVQYSFPSKYNTQEWLLILYEKKFGSSVGYNSNLLIAVEKSSAEVTDASAYLKTVIRPRIAQEGYQPKGGIAIRKLGGQEFHSMESRNADAITRLDYTALQRDYFLSLVATFKSEGQRKVIEELLNSVKFSELQPES